MDADRLRIMLEKLDGRGYKAYRQIRGACSFPRFTLYVDYVQGDPFAAPSRLRARVAQTEAGFDEALFKNAVRKTALEDYLARAFATAIGRHVKGNRGTGKSGLVAIDSGGQEILERTAAVVNGEYAEVRFAVGLPAQGRRCLGREAYAVLGEEVPRLVADSLFQSALDLDALKAHVEAAEDQDWLRSRLAEMGLVAFVADGAVLPRQSGISDQPLKSGHIVKFASPGENRIEVELPNRGPVTGMGIPEGITLVVGGGYHGKSTLLKALERGVYNHIPGDGREAVVTREDAIKIRAEDGRRVEKVNISPFIANLPFGTDTVAFSTENASGSTSQAANIIEALEAGARLLLIDEDTSATNFMIRDEMMQRLITKDKEPITPFIDQVHNLRREHNVSTVLVMGGSGDYFEAADTVIAMENYLPVIVTSEAREIVARSKEKRIPEGDAGFGAITERSPQPEGINPRRGRKEKVSAKGLWTIDFGRETVDLGSVEQLVDISQTRAIGDLVRYGLRQGYIDGKTPMRQLVERLIQDVLTWGLDVISPYSVTNAATHASDAGALPGEGASPGEGPGKVQPDACGIQDAPHPGDYALPRTYEVAAMLNRLRSLRVEQKGG